MMEEQLEEYTQMRDRDLTWEEIGVEHIVRDQWIDFRKSVYRYPDGRVFSPFYTYSRRDYAVIVASDEEGQFLCVRQFRQGIKAVTTEFPAGGLEQGANAESALEAAKRELREETGCVSDEWEHLLTIPSDATVCDNYASVFRAKNCRRSGGQSLDETEVLRVVRHTPDQIEGLIHSGQFQQAVHVMAWLLAKEEKKR